MYLTFTYFQTEIFHDIKLTDEPNELKITGSQFAQILHSLRNASSKLWQCQCVLKYVKSIWQNPQRYQLNILAHNRLSLRQYSEISMTADMTVSFCFKA